jgi:hypothetical protein
LTPLCDPPPLCLYPHAAILQSVSGRSLSAAWWSCRPTRPQPPSTPTPWCAWWWAPLWSGPWASASGPTRRRSCALPRGSTDGRCVGIVLPSIHSTRVPGRVGEAVIYRMGGGRYNLLLVRKHTRSHHLLVLEVGALLQNSWRVWLGASQTLACGRSFDLYLVATTPGTFRGRACNHACADDFVVNCVVWVHPMASLCSRARSRCEVQGTRPSSVLQFLQSRS